MGRLAEISGLPMRHALRFQAISRPEIAKYLDERIRESATPKEIDLEETALKLLGFVPSDFSLRKAMIDLLSEQAAAFYDYHRRALFLANWTPVSLRDEAVVHELAHALADQSIHLEKFIKKVDRDSEKSLAREAVVEGQASYLMLAYAAKQQGQPPLGVRPAPDQFDRALETTGGEFPVFDAAPLYMRASLVFPYTWGMAFQTAVVERLGKSAFLEVLRNPPVSTRQIIHPECYFDGEQPTKPGLPRRPRDAKVLLDGTLGELDHEILLRQYGSANLARELGSKWRGGRFRIAENKRGGGRMLLYASEWADNSAAGSFFQSYKLCLAGKWGKIQAREDSAARFSGFAKAGYFVVEKAGRIVRSEEGLPSPDWATF